MTPDQSAAGEVARNIWPACIGLPAFIVHRSGSGPSSTESITNRCCEFHEKLAAALRAARAEEREQVMQEVRANLLKNATSEWETEAEAGKVPVHSRMVGGVLCRWWGAGETPPGVAAINDSATARADGFRRGRGRARC